MNLDPTERDHLAASILVHLQRAVPGSTAVFRGSLAGTGADRYSDIDALWTVPDQAFSAAVAKAGAILDRVHPIESLRSDPTFQQSAWHRLIFVRFVDLPLFWRLDLDILAQSAGRDDVGEPKVRSDGPEWSRTESALMNAVAAVKAYLRGDETRAHQVLLPAYGRVGLDPPDLPLQNQILGLVEGVRRIDPRVEELARRVKGLVIEAFEG